MTTQERAAVAALVAAAKDYKRHSTWDEQTIYRLWDEASDILDKSLTAVEQLPGFSATEERTTCCNDCDPSFTCWADNNEPCRKKPLVLK